MTSTQLNVKRSLVLKNRIFLILLKHFDSLQHSSAMEGLCMVLKRMAYPCRYSDMILQFGRPASVLSFFTNCVVNYIYEVHAHQISWWNGNLLNRNALQHYAEVISDKGSPLNNCFGFIDGTPSGLFWDQELYATGIKGFMR